MRLIVACASREPLSPRGERTGKERPCRFGGFVAAGLHQCSPRLVAPQDRPQSASPSGGHAILGSERHSNRPDGPSFKAGRLIYHQAPVDVETQAVLFNAVPLFIVAALNLAVGLTLAPALRRDERSRWVRLLMALVFPAAAVGAGIVATEILIEREPLGGHLWLSFFAILLAAIPALVLAAHAGAIQGVFVSGARRAQEAEERSSLRDRELESVGRLSRALLDARDVDAVARALLDEIADLFELDVANLELDRGRGRPPGPDRRRARPRARQRDAHGGEVIDLDRETSGISTAVREAAAFAVFDAEASPIVNKRLNEIARVKSCAFVPMIAGDEVIGVVFAAVRKPRVFAEDELALMQSFAAEAGLALERVRAAAALAGGARTRAADRALLAGAALAARPRRAPARRRDGDRPRPSASIRCFIRLGEPGGPMPVVAEWEARGRAAARRREPAAGQQPRRARAPHDRDRRRARRRPSSTIWARRPDASSATAARRAPWRRRCRVRPADRRARPAPPRAGDLDRRRGRARRSGRAGGGDRDRHEPPPARERPARRRAAGAARGGRGADERSPLRRRDRAPGRRRSARSCTATPPTAGRSCRAGTSSCAAPCSGCPRRRSAARFPSAARSATPIATGKPVLRRDFAATEQPPPEGDVRRASPR